MPDAGHRMPGGFARSGRPRTPPASGVSRRARIAAYPDGPPGPAAGWPQRRRTLCWFLLHVFTGALVVAAVLALIALAGSWWTVPAAAAALLGTLLAGRILAWLGPALLGPSYAERLQRLEADAARATERNRIARGLRDETRSPAAPAHDLGSLDGLLTAARSAGLTVHSTVSGDLGRLPVQLGDRSRAVPRRGDRQDPSTQRAGEARRPGPRSGRHHGI
jgi:hypothetical protein